MSHILFVDDDLAIRRIAKLALEIVGGWTIELAASGAQALESAARSAPDLVVLDVFMPDMDGPATLANLRRLEAAAADAPVIFLTARAAEADVAHYLGLGACGVIAKPFDPMTLAQQIRAIVAAL